MVKIKDPKERTEKCNQEIQVILNKYECGIIATSTIQVEADGYLKAVAEAKIVSLTKIVKPLKKQKYIN